MFLLLVWFIFFLMCVCLCVIVIFFEFILWIMYGKDVLGIF